MFVFCLCFVVFYFCYYIVLFTVIQLLALLLFSFVVSNFCIKLLKALHMPRLYEYSPI